MSFKQHSGTQKHICHIPFCELTIVSSKMPGVNIGDYLGTYIKINIIYDLEVGKKGKIKIIKTNNCC